VTSLQRFSGISASALVVSGELTVEKRGEGTATHCTRGFDFRILFRQIVWLLSAFQLLHLALQVPICCRIVSISAAFAARCSGVSSSCFSTTLLDLSVLSRMSASLAHELADITVLQLG